MLHWPPIQLRISIPTDGSSSLPWESRRGAAQHVRRIVIVEGAIVGNVNFPNCEPKVMPVLVTSLREPTRSGLLCLSKIPKDLSGCELYFLPKSVHANF